LDGLGDRPIKELAGKTPLEAAETPHMDGIAEKGRCGFMIIGREGFAPETDSGAMNILGYDIFHHYMGRGLLEAYGAGLTIKEGDVGFRINFATVEDGINLVDRRVCRGLSDEEARKLVSEINSKITLTSVPSEFRICSMGGYRGVMMLRKRDGALSGNISNTDPAYMKEGAFSVPVSKYEMKVQECKPFDKSKEARETAMLVNEFIVKTHEFLNGHEINKTRVKSGKPPANMILLRDAQDRLPNIPSLETKYKIKAGMRVESFVEKGIAMLAKAKITELGGYSKDFERDYPRYAEKLASALQSVDYVYIHIKGPDDAGHDGNPNHKKDVIEGVDKLFFGNLMQKISLEDHIIALTSDHSTPCEMRTHSADPVPLVIAGGGITPDTVKKFSEKDLKKGSLNTLHAIELTPLLVKLASDPRVIRSYLKDSFARAMTFA
jgi:2,3-bisphosphoglycerate-independent phosphoglycerate mutase